MSAKKPRQKHNKRMTHTKKHIQKRRNFFFLSRRRWQPRRNREDVERLAAEFPAICDAFFCFFFLFVAENVLSKMKGRDNFKESEQIYKKHFLFVFFSLNFRFYKENSSKKKISFVFIGLLFVALSFFIFKDLLKYFKTKN